MTSDPAKPALRAELRRRRRALAKAAPDAPRLAAQNLTLQRLPPFASFAAYHAMGAELDAGPLILRLQATGARLAMPVVESADAPLVFRVWDASHVPELDLFGVSAPPPHAEAVQPDLIVCPLLAFDRRGGRLGQGGGHYDRTIEALRRLKPVFVLGLAYAGQEVVAIPLESHDQTLDAILTETSYIDVRKD